MKKITLFFVLCLTMTYWSYSQCTTSTGGQWPSSTVTVLNSGGVETIASNNWPNAEFSLLTGIQPGSEYTVSAAMYITVTNTADDSIIAFGANSVSFTAPAGVTDLTIYWHVDNSCATATGPDTVTTIQCTSCTCTETAAPNAATTPGPADGAIDVAINGTLVGPFTWTDAPGPGIDSYNLSLGTDPAASNIGTITDFPSGNSINYPSWEYNTTYYWRVDAVNCFGTTTGTVWSFTTTACTATAAPDAVTTPTPSDGALNVPIDNSDPANLVVSFEWLAATTGDPATSFDITLGDNPLTPDNIGTLTNFSSGDGIIYNWATNTTYYWSIDAVNCVGTTSGPVWSFTTASTLSTEDNLDKPALFKAYPNPVKDILNIETTLNIEQIDLFNLVGQKVKSFNETNIDNNSINLSELSKGVYMAIITAEGKRQTLKINKE